MAKRRANRMLEDIFEDCVCANECTGLFQKISVDPSEIEHFRRQFLSEE